MEEPTHYEILNVPPEAPLGAIRKRYRDLARQYHPDVNNGNPSATELFVSINRAYEVLSDEASRASYDLFLRDRRKAREEKARTTAARARPQRPRRQSRKRSQSRPRYEQALAAAEQAYHAGRLPAAIRLCQEAIQLNPTAAAHELLGDVHLRSGQPTEALHHYTFAVQQAPHDALLQSKVERLAHIHGDPPAPKDHFREDGDWAGGELVSQREWRRRIAVACGGMAAMLVAIGASAFTADTPALGWMFVPDWTKPLLTCMILAGGIGGFSLSLAKLVRGMDAEILSPPTGDTSGTLPVGWMLGFLGLIFFYAAVVVYVVVAALQESFTSSVIWALSVTGFLILAFVVLAPEPARQQVALFGGNVLFISLLGGWLLADLLFRPVVDV